MTPILLPFPEDSDGLLQKNYSSPPASFPKIDALEEVKFWVGTGAKLVKIQRLANCT